MTTGTAHGGSGRFVSFTRRDFEEFLTTEPPGEFAHIPITGEYVYACDVPGDHLRLRVFSSIERGSDRAREKGADAIRTVLWDRRVSHPVGGRERTHRIGTWRANLSEKIEHLRAVSPQYADAVGDCPECGGALVIRDGEYGEFIGCTQYPECRHTEPFDLQEATA